MSIQPYILIYLEKSQFSCTACPEIFTWRPYMAFSTHLLRDFDFSGVSREKRVFKIFVIFFTPSGEGGCVRKGGEKNNMVKQSFMFTIGNNKNKILSFFVKYYSIILVQ